MREPDKIPQDEPERLLVDFLLGHGWRGVEVRRLTAGDVNGARDGEIRSKGRKSEGEWGPLLRETHALLLRLSQGLPDGDPVLRARRSRGGVHEPLGEEGIRSWVEDLCRRAGIRAYKPHDLRRTFGTLVARASGDFHLVERLLRHGKPVVTDRYIQWDLPPLLERYSPVHLARGTGHDANLSGLDGGGISSAPIPAGPKPAGRASSLPG